MPHDPNETSSFRAGGCHLSSLIADQWQPIETAPKDWTDVILFDEERDPPVFEGYFSMEDGGRNCWMENQGMGSEPVNPTHWMPLPSPPRTKEGKANG